MAFNFDNLQRLEPAGKTKVYSYFASGDNVGAAGYFDSLASEVGDGNTCVVMTGGGVTGVDGAYQIVMSATAESVKTSLVI